MGQDKISVGQEGVGLMQSKKEKNNQIAFRKRFTDMAAVFLLNNEDLVN